MPISRLLHPTLIVGADGLIGHALLVELTFKGIPVIGTTRRKPSRSHSQILLDLNQSSATWNLPERIHLAYICAGVASIAECEKHPKATHLVNTDATITLAGMLARRGAHVIHLSSNQVFDGSTPSVTADTSTSPQTHYGRQKAETEHAILKLIPDAAILRLSKVLAHGNPLLEQWRNTLKKNQAIHPFSDMRMAPVSLPLVLDTLLAIGRRHAQGIFQLSASQDITYTQAANWIAKSVPAPQTLIQPISAATAAITSAATPLHTTMDPATLASLGITQPTPWQTLDTVMDLHPVLPAHP